MIYKFPKPANLFNGLLDSFTGCYNALYVPKTEQEKYCYAHLTRKQKSAFLTHFGENGGCVVKDDSVEYPGSAIAKLNDRTNNFILFIKRHQSPINLNVVMNMAV